MFPIKQIYIDNRFKSSDSASHSEFKIDLPLTFLMPEDTGFYKMTFASHTHGILFQKGTT